MVSPSDLTSVFIIDNGAYNLKVGTNSQEKPKLVPNSVVKAKHERKRVFVADEIAECIEKTALFYVRSIERGYVVNWDTQQQIWDRVISSQSIDPRDHRLVFTDTNYLVPALPDVSNEVIFEHFQFHSAYKSSAPSLISEHSYRLNKNRCAIVVDVGFSFTHVAPFVDGLLIQEAVIRIDLGGKALTNKLKDWISYRQLNVMEETHVINECKEDVCFLSQDFVTDISLAKKKTNDLMRRYILPDFEKRHRGIVETLDTPFDRETQAIVLGVERFALPELLFNPSDIDIDQIGVAEAVVASINRCPTNLRPALSENIIVVGGSTKFPGFVERLQKEVRSLLVVEFNVNVSTEVFDPEIHAWQCAQQLFSPSKSCDFLSFPWVSRSDWTEYGDSVEFSRFLRTLRDAATFRELTNQKEDDNESVANSAV